MCVSELALLRAFLPLEITTLTHIPGLANTVADALSRRFAPDALEVPAFLEPSSEAASDERDGLVEVSPPR